MAHLHKWAFVFIVLSTMLETAVSHQAAAQTEDAKICTEDTGDVAIAACTRVLKDDPNSAEAYYNRGVVWRHKGNYDNAIGDYSEAIKLNPSYVSAYNNRGFAWSNKGEYDRAIADFNEAIRLDSQHANSYNNRGNAWASKGEYDKAIADLDEVIRLNPKFALGYNNRGNALSDKGQYEKAIADYNDAISLNPNYAQAYYNRANAWSAKNNYDAAIADYSEAIRLDPQDASSYFLLGIVYYKKNEYSEAEKHFLASFNLKQDSYAVLWRYLALSRTKQEAKGELAKNAASLNNKDWAYPIIEFYLDRRTLKETQSSAVTDSQKCELSYYVAEWHILRSEQDSALKELDVAIAICPRSFIEYDAAKNERSKIASVYLDKAKSAENDNRLEDAVKATTKASSIDPDNKSILEEQIRFSDNLNQQKFAQLEAARKAAEERMRLWIYGFGGVLLLAAGAAAFIFKKKIFAKATPEKVLP